MPHKTSQNATAEGFRPKPLCIEQRNAIPLLCAGLIDAEVGRTVGVARETVWSWRHDVPLYMSELEQARQQYISTAVDKLRNAVPKAVENVVNAVEGGSLKASLELLRCVGLSRHGDAFQASETDAGENAMNLCLERLAREGTKPNTELDRLSQMLNPINPAYEQRRAEILAELAGDASTTP